MALYELFAADRRPGLTEVGGGLTLRFDASLSETHSIDVEWTSEPLPSGASLSDHRIVRQRRLPLTVLVSSTTFAGLFQAKHIKAWNQLVGIANAEPPLLFEVTTGVEVLPNCVLGRATYPRAPETGNALEAQLLLIQLEFSQVDVATNLALAAQDPGLGEVDLGGQGFD